MDQVQGIIFDCDGVLFESRNANLAYYNRILAAFEYDLVTPEQKQRAHLCHTASSPDVLTELMSPDDVSAALEFAAQLDYREFIPFMEPEPFLTLMLQGLAQKFPLAVATNRGASIRAILEHFQLDDFFNVIVNSRDVLRPKPAPDMLLLAVKQLNLAPQNCLFIGDSELDQLAASSADVPFVGYGGHVAGDYQLQDHRQLLTWLGEPLVKTVD